MKDDLDFIYQSAAEFEKLKKNKPEFYKFYNLLCNARAACEDTAIFLATKDAGMKIKIVPGLNKAALMLGQVQDWLLEKKGVIK